MTPSFSLEKEIRVLPSSTLADNLYITPSTSFSSEILIISGIHPVKK